MYLGIVRGLEFFWAFLNISSYTRDLGRGGWTLADFCNNQPRVGQGPGMIPEPLSQAEVTSRQIGGACRFPGRLPVLRALAGGAAVLGTLAV